MEDPELTVVDASVVLKWQLDDEDCVSQATALRDDYYARGAITLIAPQLLLYEVVNGIATATRRKRLTPDKAIEAMDNLLVLGIELREVEPLKVLEMALRHDLAAYDAAYLTLAEAESCDLWTGDRAFYQAIKEESSHVRWIGDYAKEL
ncbi:MAG: type II toxin-antitoxin system VapC family toxin [Dehalococcoidales bacterium]|nr:type II toxin-antitoxin system VapC family toxin [Dehalococcoidales bacterium]